MQWHQRRQEYCSENVARVNSSKKYVAHRLIAIGDAVVHRAVGYAYRATVTSA